MCSWRTSIRIVRSCTKRVTSFGWAQQALVQQLDGDLLARGALDPPPHRAGGALPDGADQDVRVADAPATEVDGGGLVEARSVGGGVWLHVSWCPFGGGIAGDDDGRGRSRAGQWRLGAPEVSGRVRSSTLPSPFVAFLVGKRTKSAGMTDVFPGITRP
ncbi:hypothetical protein GCM10020358_67050 [Amorphoplanes nipponensis]